MQNSVPGTIGRPSQVVCELGPDDVMRRALTAPGPEVLEIERCDGFRNRAHLDWWLRDPAAPPPTDVAALDWITGGPVLDIGCATGRHVELLRDRGIEATGIDSCPAAVELATRAGIDCRVGDAWRPPVGAGYAAVTALGANLGIAGAVARVPGFLGALATALRPGGQLIVTSIDWRQAAGPHGEFVAERRRAGRYPGDARLRLRLGETVSSWFDWVWVDRDSLDAAASEAGLRVAGVMSWRHHYAARLVAQDR